MKNGFGNQLREWRNLRKKSQLELALDAEISSKHIRFLETGRANPSKEMIHRLSDAIHFILKQQEPYPAILINSIWNVLRLNHSAKDLFAILFPGSFMICQNLLELIFHLDGFRKETMSHLASAVGN